MDLQDERGTHPQLLPLPAYISIVEALSLLLTSILNHCPV